MRGSRVGWGALLLLATWIAVSAQSAVAAGQPSYEENHVKGAFLAKFTLFVEWPTNAFASAKAPVVIGVIGEDPFGPQYESALKKESANGRPFQLVRFKEASEIKKCHILFVSSSASSLLPDILKVTRPQPILVVGDEPRFAHRGGMVNFLTEGEKLRFEDNTAAVEAAGLKMSAKLLQVARPVKTDLTKEEAR